MKKQLLKGQVQSVAETLTDLMRIPAPSLGIDLDGVVDEAPIFMQILTQRWPGKVFVISYRDDRQKAVDVLQKYGIRFDELILVKSFDEKAIVISREGILVYFDDQPEMLKHVLPQVNVMLVRNEGNFDFDQKKWMFSNETGYLV